MPTAQRLNSTCPNSPAGFEGRNEPIPDGRFGRTRFPSTLAPGVVSWESGRDPDRLSRRSRGQSRLNVRAMGKQSFDAEIIAADPRSDLAVIVPKRGPGSPLPQLTPLPIGDATKLRKGSFLIALGNSVQRGRSRWPSLRNLGNPLERRTPARDDSGGTEILEELPDPAPARRQAQPGNERKRRDQHQRRAGRASRPISANAAGFDAQAGYAIPMDALGRRAVETLKQGKEVEYGFLGVALDTENLSNRVKSAQAGTPAAEGEVHANDTILFAGDLPIHDVDSLFLAINHFTPEPEGGSQTPPKR